MLTHWHVAIIFLTGNTLNLPTTAQAMHEYILPEPRICIVRNYNTNPCQNQKANLKQNYMRSFKLYISTLKGLEIQYFFFFYLYRDSIHGKWVPSSCGLAQHGSILMLNNPEKSIYHQISHSLKPITGKPRQLQFEKLKNFATLKPYEDSCLCCCLL